MGSPKLVLRDSTLQDGPPGGGSQVDAGRIVTLSGAARRLLAPRVVREREMVTLRVEGEQGDLVLLLVSSGFRPVYKPALGASFLLSTPWINVPLGVISAADGGKDLTATGPLLPSGTEAVLVYQQALFFSASGSLVPSSGQALLLLDDSIAP